MALLKKSAKSVEKVLYTFEDDVRIMKLTEGGKSAKEVAKEVGRSIYSLRYRLMWLRSDKCPNTLEDLKKYHNSKSKK